LGKALQFVKPKAPSRTESPKSNPSRTRKPTPPSTGTTRTEDISRESTGTESAHAAGDPNPTTSTHPNAPASAQSPQQDLLPAINRYKLLKFTTENTGDDTNVLPTSAVECIPESLELRKGVYSKTLIARRHYLVRDAVKFAKAAAALFGSPYGKEGLDLSGEVSMTAVFHSAVLNPIHRICKAMFAPTVSWEMVGLGNAPKTDLLLQVNGENAAVIEVKIPTALNKGKISQAWKTLERLKMGELPLPPRKSTESESAESAEPSPKRQKLANATKYKSLVDPEDVDSDERHRGNRDKTVLMMEQVRLHVAKNVADTPRLSPRCSGTRSAMERSRISTTGSFWKRKALASQSLSWRM